MSNTKRWPPPRITFGEDEHIRHKYSMGTTKDFQRLANLWYAEHIEPLGAGVEVQGYTSASDGKVYWHEHPMADTHRAILIGIEPMKEEPSAEELLEDLVRASYDYGPELEKARAYLAKRK